MRHRLFSGIERFDGDIALIEPGGTRRSYRELTSTGDELASALGPQRRLVLAELANHYTSIAFYIGALRAGHVVIPVQSVEHGSAAISSIFRPSATHLFDGQRWTCSIEQDSIDLHSDLAVLLSTSGSTGSPKLVRLSHDNLAANAASIAEYLELSPGERAITSLPLHYSYGLSVLHSHLLFGHTLVLTEHSVVDEQFWELVEREQVTSLAGVPHTYELLARTDHLDRDLPSLRYLTQAGGKLAPQRVRELALSSQQKNRRFYVMYGQTEAAPRMAFLPPADAAEHGSTIGCAIPGGSFHLDHDGIEAADGSGELVYEGPNVMMGYALGPADLAKPQGSRELRTGDIAVQEPSGYYRIVGRQSRFAKLFGLRLSFDDIEKRFSDEEATVAVTGNDNGLIIAVTPAEAERGLDNRVAEALGIPANLISVTGVSTIPRLPTGKVDYRGIAALRDAKPAAEGGRLLDQFKTILGRSDLDDRESFSSLGGDSLTYVQASLAVEDSIGSLPPNWENMPIVQLESMIGKEGEPRASARSLLSISAFDVIRSGAIAAALLAHSLGRAGVQVGTVPSFVLRLVTPMLIILFGVMIALLHEPRMRSEGVRRTFAHCLTKSVQCYLLFAINVFAIWAQQPSGWKFAALTLAFLGSMPYAQILSFYTVLFLLIPLLVVAIRRIGFWSLFAGFLAVHLLYPLLKAAPDLRDVNGQPIFQRLIDFTIGTGSHPEIAGPSLLHSMVLLLAGYWIGTITKKAAERPEPRAAFTKEVYPLAGILLGYLAWSFLVPNAPVEVSTLTSMRLRNLNHPAYTFVYGSVCVLLLVVLLRASWTRRVPNWMTHIGHRSLFAFGFGNLIVTMAPARPDWLASRGVYAAMIFCAVLACAYAYDFCLRHGKRLGGAPKFVLLVTREIERQIGAFSTHVVMGHWRVKARPNGLPNVAVR
jgi:hypothetical protein